jgi:hypothetical protein
MNKKIHIQDVYNTYRHIDWIVSHIAYYRAEGEGEELREKLIRYGGNYYVYPYEAQKAYENFVAHIWNNPFLYETTPLEAVKYDINYCIFSTSIDGYVVEYEENNEKYYFPIGYVRDELGEKENIDTFRSKINEMILEFRKQKENIEQNCQSKIDEYQQMKTHLVEKRLGKAYVEPNVNKLSFAERKFNKINVVDITEIIMTLIVYLSVAFSGHGNIPFRVIGIGLGIFDVIFILNNIKIISCMHKIRTNMGTVEKYYMLYHNMLMWDINFESTFCKREKDSVTPPEELLEQYQKVKYILDYGGIYELREIKIPLYKIDYFVIEVSVILIFICFIYNIVA